MARLIMIGTCSNCGKTVTSKYPFEVGECSCHNPPVQVPLELAILPAPKIQKALQKVSKLSGVPADQLAEALLKEITEAVKKGLRVAAKEKMREASLEC